jgi:glycosyltransferase involved in cell wall biosynthesis
MNRKRILIVSGFSAFFTPGGGEEEAASLCRTLNLEGYNAELYGPTVSQLESYNCVIYFSCHPSGLELLESCRNLGLNFIFWPNLWFEHNSDLLENQIEIINKYCELSDKVIIKSKTEEEIFNKKFILNKEKILKINWFIDPPFEDISLPDRFRSLYSVENYILSVGLIEPEKNQLAIIEAIHDLNKKLILIGGYRKKEYFDKCVDAAGESVLFIPHQSSNSPILKAAYAGCDTYIEVSFDPPGRSAIEAAFYEKPLVLSSSEWSNELFHSTATMVDPTDVMSIRNGIIKSTTSESSRTKDWKDKNLKYYLPATALKTLFDYLKI